jgi:hypothetical protein
MAAMQRAQLMASRFMDELGYLSAKAWPIRERLGQGRVMYHMIHATDHEAAPGLMERAYVATGVVDPKYPQLTIPGT